MSERHPIWQMLDKLQMDNRQQAAKLIELRALVAGINLPDPAESKCPLCGTKFSSHLTRDEHIYQSHSGPVPDHYLAAERAAGIA